ncbi:LysR family transcriptional regulator [Sphingomonas sp. MG17]|uniref:LysR family transcriptional regulator n=1 Tax=Sphingomonas tagetis TaxID=2949092 RepID=A0A9X2HLF8_9SPHN|nr:LysR family transcriptional regulator [Sphingomonas tagetis]
MRFQRLDLNLLVALDVLLEEKSVSLAADRLCLSQSATSSALGRLREYFKDELLLLKGRQMILTPRAEELIDPVRAVLEQIRTTVAVAPEFEPESCDRQIRIMASDYSTEVLLTEVIARLAVTAPLMRFEIQGMASAPVESLERGLIDLLLTVDFALSADHPSEILFQDDYLVVGDATNPALATELTREAYFELSHVTTRFGRSRIPAFDDWFLRRQKQARRIEVVAPTFLSLPGLLIGTHRVATMHRKLAERVLERFPLAAQEVPFDIPPIREGIQWHLTSRNDFAIQWMIGQLRTVALELFGKGPGESQDHGRIGVEFQADTFNRRG